MILSRLLCGCLLTGVLAGHGVAGGLPWAAAMFQEPVAPVLKLGQTVPAFELKDYRGTPFNIGDGKDTRALLVVFVGVECPLVKLYASRLSELQREYGDRLQVIGINANRQDSLEELAQFAKTNGVEFPLLKDPGNHVADAFGAQRTPESFLFDPTGRLRYRGAIDDQFTYGQQKKGADKTFLADAVAAVLENRRPVVEAVEAEGCLIGRVLKPDASSEVTYARQISRILQASCVECHREGEVGPFSLTDYDEVVGWAEMISEVTRQRRMPPWHANPEHGKFKNDISLTDAEVALIESWVAAGAPFGDSEDLPEPRPFEVGWRIGKPDLIIPMAQRPYSVSAIGPIPYQYFEVDPGFKEDKWVQAAECRIGNRAVVHHVLVAIKDREQVATHGEIESEWLAATAPGSSPMILPPGLAKRIPAGSKLVFQLHYTPNGVPQTDLSQIGLIFADPDSVRQEVGTRQVVNAKFKIPPGVPDHPVTARYPFPKDSLIWSMFPHMHLRGKSFRYTALYPDGTSEILLDVPHYDFNWQNGYSLEHPKRMPAGTVLECVAHYDNSAGNFANPDPSQLVKWGDQTTDEMMIGYFNMTLEAQDLRKKSTGTDGE